MRVFSFGIFFLLLSILETQAQKPCDSYSYQQAILERDPLLKKTHAEVEAFVQRRITENAARGGDGVIIKIPVVVHILYNSPNQNIPDKRVTDQIAALNQYFRRLHADTIKTPLHFRNVAADCEIEFQLAISDPRRRSTTGIVRKYTPVATWEADDKMKFSSETGDDAWDSQNYLNIWVCNIRRQAGYASFPGGPAATDGIVLDFGSFGINAGTGYELGKTAVHEVGHWLGLRHIWGDDDCGNDGVDDTPVQNNFTMGCPSGIRTSCGNAPTGDMYMNFMDVTTDLCTNLFTEGQKKRMRTLFEPGGSRSKILTTTAFLPPLISEIPVEEGPPRWTSPRLYPNPANNEVSLDVSNDIRWLGKILKVTNFQGQMVMQVSISSRVQVINLTKLPPGVYFVSAKKEDGATISEKIMKL